jgi:hypothetical protein
LVLSGALLANAPGAPLTFRSGEKQVGLIELYTSEGCSSCPPAETWISNLKDSPDLWRQFVPMAFHVDYWNSIGWKDRWSSPDFSDRQRAYAAAWKSDTIYTPCFVLNGNEWHSWFNSRGVSSASDEIAGVLEVKSSDTNHWSAVFIPAALQSSAYDVHAALLASGLGSDVTAGENSGRHLRHDFVVISTGQNRLVTKNGAAKGKFILDLPKGAASGALAVAVWVTSAEQLAPLQATGGWLPSSGNASR